MPDAFTPEERAALDAYDGPVTQCETNAMATAQEYRWCSEKSAIVAVGGAKHTVWRKAEHPNAKRKREGKERRERIVALVREGKSPQDVADEMRMTPGSVWRIAREAGHPFQGFRRPK